MQIYLTLFIDMHVYLTDMELPSGYDDLVLYYELWIKKMSLGKKAEASKKVIQSI